MESRIITDYRQVEVELARRKQEDPLGLVYKPHAAQQAAHKTRKRFTLVLGGNRAGKTWFAVAEALLYCLGRATWAEVPNGPVDVGYVMPSIPMFNRAILPIIKKLAPRDQIKLTATGDIMTKQEKVIRFKNGSVLHFLSADMKQRRLQGFPLDLAIMDETPDEAVYEEMQARITDRRGRLLLVFSPIDAKTYWVRDKLYLPWQAGDNRDIDVVFMPVADSEGHSLVPHLSDEDVQAMQRQWPDPAVQAARIYGQFVARSGLVFKSYERDIHVVKAFKVPDNYARWLVCDPEYHRFAVGFFAADDQGSYYMTDEIFSQDESLARRAEKMAVMVGKRDIKLPVYVDTANPQDTHELNWHFSRIGAPLGAIPLPFPKQVDKMVLRVHALLEPDDERPYAPITGWKGLYGAPRIMFFDTLMSTWKHDARVMNCSRMLWEIQRLSWGKNDKPDKDSADGADCCDVLIYGCSVLMSGIAKMEPEQWRRGLGVEDIILWDAIDRADRQKEHLVNLRED